MDIYILKNGQETGPFSEEATQTLLKEGTIYVNDLAWRPGMPTWEPLVRVLYPAAPEASVACEPEPPCDPATPKQKAFLSYMGIHFSPDLTKERASQIINETMETPRFNTRVKQWGEDRLHMFPELFAEEIQQRKENRAQFFSDVCRVQGGDHFTTVTKAHCQVLVGYLDVRFPNWDAHEEEAAWSYFFPAVAEKFPALVKKPWRGKLKYHSGPRVAPELVQKRPVARAQAHFPMVAVVRGLVCGLGILLVLYVGYQMHTGDAKNPEVVPPLDRSVTPLSLEAVPNSPIVKISSSEIAIEQPPKSRDSIPPAPEEPMPNTDPAQENDSVPAPTDAFSQHSASTSFPATPVPSLKKGEFKLIKELSVRSRYGDVVLINGTVLKLVSNQGRFVRGLFGKDEFLIPISYTNLGATPTAR